jgi:hypothetical protein
LQELDQKVADHMREFASRQGGATAYYSEFSDEAAAGANLYSSAQFRDQPGAAALFWDPAAALRVCVRLWL